MQDTVKGLDKVRELIQSQEFLEGKGLSNEVNIRIFCYDAKDEMAVRSFVEQLKTDQSLPCRLLVYNLYEVFLSICKDMDILDTIPEIENRDGSAFLAEQLESAVGADAFIRKMKIEEARDRDVLLLTGVGEVFPFLRLHKLLETLQPHYPDTPILVMYPGEFDKHSLKLFDRLKPNDYYRAFNVV